MVVLLCVATRYEPKDPSVRMAMREVLVQPGAIKGGFLLVEPLISQDK